MALDEATVRHVANLARLHLEEDEIGTMAEELNAIVGYVEQLAEVNTDGVEPIANVAGLENITRADEERAMLSSKEVLSNAPQANEVAFLVPKAVDR